MLKNFLDKLEQDVMVIDRLGTILFCNERLLERRSTSEEIVNTKIGNKIIINKNLKWQDIIKEHIDQKVSLEMKQGEGKSINFEGKLFLDQWNGKDAYFIVMTPIEKEIYTKKDLEDILDAMPYTIWLERNGGCYSFMNHPGIVRMTNITGKEYERGDIIGKSILEVWGEKISEIDYEADKDRVRAGESLVADRGITLDNGINTYYKVVKVPIMNSQQEVESVVGIIESKTVEKDVEAYIDTNQSKLMKQLKEMKIEKRLTVDKQLEKIGEISCALLDAESLYICLFDKEKQEMYTFKRFGPNKAQYISDFRKHISEQDFVDLVNEKTWWKVGEIERRIGIAPRKEFKEQGIQFLTQHPISYNNEILGTLIISYKEDKKNYLLANNVINNLCGNWASLINSIRLSNKLQEELIKRHQIEKEQQILIELATDVVAVVNKDLKIESRSDSWKKIFGEGDFIDLSKIHSEDRAKIINNYSMARRKWANIFSEESRCRCLDNTWKWFRWKAKYIEKRELYYIVGKDISIEKEVEAERIAYKEAIHLEKIKSEFYNNISHEIRTPLNLIISTMQLMEIEQRSLCERSEEARKFGEKLNIDKRRSVIKRNTYRLLRLMNNIVDMTSLNTGTFKLSYINCEIVKLVKEIIRSISKYVNDNKVNIHFQSEIDELILACDPELIERIILNLISNAIKYSEANGNIYIRVNRKDEQFVLAVEDEGIGIPKEECDHIFDDFIQIDKSLTRRCEGSGIGLSLVKAFVKLHKGKIYVNSELGKGSIFTVEMPISQLDGPVMSFEEEEHKRRIEKCSVEFSDIYSIC